MSYKRILSSKTISAYFLVSFSTNPHWLKITISLTLQSVILSTKEIILHDIILRCKNECSESIWRQEILSFVISWESSATEKRKFEASIYPLTHVSLTIYYSTNLKCSPYWGHSCMWHVLCLSFSLSYRARNFTYNADIDTCALKTRTCLIDDHMHL